MNEVIKKIIEERQTVKSYLTKPIPEADWLQVLEMIKWAPSSHGFEPYRILIIKHANKELREALKSLMWNQPVVTEADRLVLFIALKRRVFAAPEWIKARQTRRGITVFGKTLSEAELGAEKFTDFTLKNQFDDGNEKDNGDEWAIKQAYIALAMALVGATILNIGSTPMEGFNRAQVNALLADKKLLNPMDETVAVVAAFGYAANKEAYDHHGTNDRVRDEFIKKFQEI